MIRIKHHPKSEHQLAQLGRHSWSVARLINLTKNFKVMEIPLEHMYTYHIFKEVTLREMVGHIDAVNKADLSYPIILDEDGELMDGRHRLMKAILIGAKTIKAVRFEHNPKPCKVSDE